MGGASTEVGERTSRVILESAIFHGPTIRNTARRLGLRSEASMRHEKGIGWELPRYAADRAAQLIAEITNARVARGIVDNDPEPKERRVIPMSLVRTRRLLGIDVDAARAGELLSPLGFEVTAPAPQADEVSVSVPSHRLDVTLPADVAEEIARSYGYDRIPGRLPQAVLPPFRPDPSAGRNEVRRILAGLGLDELVTPALIAPDDLARAGYDREASHLVRVANPLSEEHSVLRPVLYPSLLGALRENVRHRRTDAWVFEVGRVYWYQPDRPGQRERHADTAGTGRYEAWEVGIALLGSGAPRSIGEAPRAAEVAELKGVIEALHAALGAPAPGYRAEGDDERHPHLHPGRAGRVVDAAGRDYGSIGEVDPRIAESWDLPGRPVVAAISLDQLLAHAVPVPQVVPVPTAQPVDRDLAVVVAGSTPIGELLRIARMSAGPMLVDLRLFDAYRGPQVGEGRVSYALAMRFQPTSAGDEKSVDKALNKVRGSLTHHLGAEIR
jgi:phenylalanyl-tRNA synthetase beta chain